VENTQLVSQGSDVTIDGRLRDGVAFSADRVGYLAPSECMVGPAGQEEHDPKLDDSDSNWLITERLTVRRGRPKHDFISMPLLAFEFPEEVEVASGCQFAVFERSVTRVRCLAMVHQLMQSASKRWRLLNGATLLPEVIAGVQFTDGVKSQQAAA
jgi:hypothetical protein